MTNFSSCYAPQLTVSDREILTPAQVRELHRKYSKRRLTKTCLLLFQHHYGFAVRTAMRYVRPEFPADEAISASVRGLLEALRRYKPSKGAFTTFSYWWMIKFILQEKAFALDVVRLPVGLVRQSRRAQRLRVELGADDFSIARELGVDVVELSHLEDLHVAPRSVPIHMEETTNHVAALEDSAPNPREALEAGERPPDRERMQMELDHALHTLGANARMVVLARHREDPESFDSLAKKLRTNRDAVRKIYAQAMQQLREQCE